MLVALLNTYAPKPQLQGLALHRVLTLVLSLQSAPAVVNMSDQRYEQLDVLLTQTNLYSKFLSEQMENLAQVSTPVIWRSAHAEGWCAAPNTQSPLSRRLDTTPHRLRASSSCPRTIN